MTQEITRREMEAINYKEIVSDVERIIRKIVKKMKIKSINADDVFAWVIEYFHVRYDALASEGSMVFDVEDDIVCWAGYHGNIKMIKYFSRKGLSDCGEAMMWAGRHGHLDIVKYLFSKGIYENAIRNTFALSISCDQLDIARFLIKNGVAITNDNILKSCVFGFDKSETGKRTETLLFILEEYLEKNIPIPDNVITKEINQVNQILLNYVSPDKHILFHSEIVSRNVEIKSARKY